jgi:uncharacterized protein DUF1007
MGALRRNWRQAALGLAFGLTAPAQALAHPHVWVTVKSQIEFTGGKVSAVVHDWVFDEMYSSFAIQGLAPPGQLVTKAEFACQRSSGEQTRAQCREEVPRPDRQRSPRHDKLRRLAIAWAVLRRGERFAVNRNAGGGIELGRSRFTVSIGQQGFARG